MKNVPAFRPGILPGRRVNGYKADSSRYFAGIFRPCKRGLTVRINGVAAEAVGFKDRSVTLRSSNGEAATEKGVESVEKKLVIDQGGRRVSLL
ncbi:hypothetical protein TNCV_5137001 [Trichonephila clavipes]|nr:hypothetical protein TNCV_5137001 [Trichonephila clavipes]